MVKIRLKRMGTTKRPVYRLVVADSRSPRDGRFIEAIGFYDPLPNPAVVRIDEEKVRTWMRNGARPSESARFLLVQQGLLAPLPRKTHPVKETVSGPAAAGSPPPRSPELAAAGSAPPASPDTVSSEPEAPAAATLETADATDAAAAEPAPAEDAAPPADEDQQ